MTTRDGSDDLRRLAEKTAALRAPRGLSERVMAAVEREAREPWRARGIVLGVFAAAAALSIWLSWSAESALDGQALSAFDVVELEQ